MVKCGSCKESILDLDGNERERESDHSCVKCKASLHSITFAASCNPWMLENGFYFCGQQCLQERNTEVIREAAEGVGG
jgi:hypothetical protein